MAETAEYLNWAHARKIKRRNLKMGIIRRKLKIGSAFTESYKDVIQEAIRRESSWPYRLVRLIDAHIYKTRLLLGEILIRSIINFVIGSPRRHPLLGNYNWAQQITEKTMRHVKDGLKVHTNEEYKRPNKVPSWFEE